MRNKWYIVLLLLLMEAPLFAQADSAASDTTKKLISPSSPLGISEETGLALFIVVLLFLVFAIFLWRRRLDRAMGQEQL